MAKKQVVAVDIGTHTAKMVQLEQSSAGTRLINADIVTYAETGNQQQVAKSIENLWASLGKPPRQGNLSSLFNRHKTEVVLALPASLGEHETFSQLTCSN